MKGINRYQKYQQDGLTFDELLLKIKQGVIKCGRYSHLVKIDNNYKIKGKELFNDGRKNKSDS